jgi:hypothetical protein
MIDKLQLVCHILKIEGDIDKAHDEDSWDGPDVGSARSSCIRLANHTTSSYSFSSDCQVPSGSIIFIAIIGREAWDILSFIFDRFGKGLIDGSSERFDRQHRLGEDNRATVLRAETKAKLVIKNRDIKKHAHFVKAVDTGL